MHIWDMTLPTPAQQYAFWMTPSFPCQLRTYLTDGPLLNPKTYKDIRISHSRKYKLSKKSISLRKNKF